MAEAARLVTNGNLTIVVQTGLLFIKQHVVNVEKTVKFPFGQAVKDQFCVETVFKKMEDLKKDEQMKEIFHDQVIIQEHRLRIKVMKMRSTKNN